jgi:two-component system chemotaxis response regulator CheY
MMAEGRYLTAAGHAAAADWQLPGARIAKGRLETPGQAPLVLLVDDDPDLRMLCSVNLRIEGLNVLEASDGGGGLARARSERPDLVVTDVAMPGRDGFQLAEALRSDEKTRQIPLIFLSGDTGPDNAARAQQLGALAYLRKPFHPDTLSSLVAGILAWAGTRVRPAAPRRAGYLH